MKKIMTIFLAIILSLNTVVATFATGSVVKEPDDTIIPSEFTSLIPDGDKKETLPVDVRAKSAVLMDVETGEVLLSYNPDVKLYPASVTKIMTILLVAEAIAEKKITLADSVSCSENAASKGGSQIWLEPGERMTVDELLRATVIGSANDAATLLGEYVSGSEQAFIDLMNRRADELGMKNTNFVNATGLDDTSDNHLTTSRDIALMSRELLKHEFITEYTTVWMDSLRNGKTELVNTNKLVRFYDGTTGLKTGTTAKAGCCISASARRDGLHLVAVVMGSENSNDRFNTAKALLNWGFSNYTSYTPGYNAVINDVRVLGGRREFLKVNMPELSPILIKKGEEDKVKVAVELCGDVEAPVLKNQTLGSVTVKISDKVVNVYKITAKDEIEKLTLFDCIIKIFNFISNGKTAYPL